MNCPYKNRLLITQLISVVSSLFPLVLLLPGAVPAIALTTISSFQMVCLGENNVPIFGKIVVLFVEFIGERIHFIQAKLRKNLQSVILLTKTVYFSSKVQQIGFR